MDTDVKAPILAQPDGLPPPAWSQEVSERRHVQKKRRFVKFAVLSVMLIWLGVHSRHHLKHGAQKVFSALSADEHKMAASSWPIPDEYSADCVQWSNVEKVLDIEADHRFPYSAEANIEIPITADSLFVVSHAVRHHTVLAGGRVQFLQSEEVVDKLQIGVTAHVHREKDLKHVKTCLLEGEAGARGAGLFTNWASKSHHRHRRQPRFRLDVVVAFPAMDKDSPLAVKEFWTNMTAFSQEFYDLSGVAFDSLNVRNFLGPISAENLKAKAANIETDFGPIRIGSLNVTAANVTTTMGPISGSFFASDSLSLKTSNGPSSPTSSFPTQTRRRDLLSSSSTPRTGHIIDSSVDLSTTKDESAFDLIAKTSNGRLALAVPSAPIDSTITLDARTAFGSAHVKLPATFEGAFSASTSIGAASLKADENAPDPSGQGRARKVVVDAAGRTNVQGSVGWSEEGLARGNAHVETSIASVVLEL
ncbi:unnamed protein product [Mycena citricolor]|uniref:Uncharacterized protein n=1 Tax=Mycena citricolor TaxID=2018698 RepID=A0AAD2HGS1_9AGAR|nr:unnamed protein product [Mycena citricolor]